MRGVISIFAMPQEIDDLHLTLYNLRRNMSFIPDTVEMDLHLTFCVSDELTNWEETQLPREFFIEKLKTILPLADWSKNPTIHIEDGSEILGCVSQRRKTLELYEDYDFTLWLDTDIFFTDHTLCYSVALFDSIRGQGLDLPAIVTPEFVRQWDPTWDTLVAQEYKNEPLMFHESFDPFLLTFKNNPDKFGFRFGEYKFAGGWFTLLSNSLLKMTGVPESFGHYGLEDTFVVECSNILRNSDHSGTPVQGIVKNMVVAENYTYRCNNYLKQMVSSKNRKEEFRAIAHKNYASELVQFKNRMGL